MDSDHRHTFSTINRTSTTYPALWPDEYMSLEVMKMFPCVPSYARGQPSSFKNPTRKEHPRSISGRPSRESDEGRSSSSHSSPFERRLPSRKAVATTAVHISHADQRQEMNSDGRRLEQHTEVTVSKIEASIWSQMHIEVQQALQLLTNHMFSEGAREIHQREVRSERLQRQSEGQISRVKFAASRRTSST